MKKTGLFSTDFGYVWPGQFISQMGTSLHAIGFSYYLKTATDSASLVGSVSFATGMLALLALPIAGVVCDVLSRRNIVLRCDFLCASLIVMLALGFHAFDTERSRVILLCMTAPLIGIISVFFRPAFGAMLPDIVGREQLAKANSLYKGGARLGELFGSVSGGLLYRAFGPTVLFTLNGCSYLIAYILMRKTSFHLKVTAPSTTLRPKLSWKPPDLLRNFGEGLKQIRTIRGASEYLCTAVSINVFAAPILVYMPFHASSTFGGDALIYATLMGSLSCGIFLGYLTAAFLPIKKAASSTSITATIVLMCFCFLGFARSHELYVAASWLSVAGLANGYWSVFFETGMQSSLPRHLLGRVFATLGLGSGIAVPFSTLCAGVWLDRFEHDTHVLFTVCAFGMTIVPTTLLLFSANYRAFFERFRDFQ